MAEDRVRETVDLGKPKQPERNPREAAEGGEQAPAPKQPEPVKPQSDNKP